MFRYTGIVVGLIVGGFGLPALAASVTSENPVATVEPVAGQVSLSRGDGFKGIKGPTNAQVGDQVMVSTRSRAKIVYLEGCVIDVNPGAVVGVAPSCKVAMAKPMMAGLGAAPVVATQGFPWGAAAIGTAVAVGVACIGFCQNDEEHHHHVKKVKSLSDQ